MLGAISVGLGLFAIINLDGVEGPCFNPVIGIVQTAYQGIYYTGSSDSLSKYLWAYTLGPAVGGMIAGFAQIFHKKNVAEMK